MSAILVTGGTGTLGRSLVRLLTGRGAAVRVLSRRPRPAPSRRTSGTPATSGAAGASRRPWPARTRSSTAPPDAATPARPGPCWPPRGGQADPHLVYISIVGIDRIGVGYYRSKLETERLIAGSGLPWTVLRATQFHDLIARGCAALARLPVLPVPAATSFQPVDAGEVAARLAELAAEAPAGRVPDMAGPQVRTAADLAGSYLRTNGRHRRVQPVWLPGRAAAALRRGDNLAPGRACGRVTFEEFLGGHR